ncbi:DUF2835 family protein [Pleionea litopenaei]|uniref:DUF2835 family protein n=1 Tax=Pleionea litopenaei TaxID=3070815 RepID=A0AA51RTN2_9GAMM|nr:DUF2835 family protein [Pleionea sp. HL-JVS1]WMS87453.1 DUF2835 family protein [Pleionea sp. HL-JVS1]
MSQARQFEIDIQISAAEWEKIYRGYYPYVKCYSTTGTRIWLPVKHLRPYVQHDGVHGRFQLHLSESNQFLSIARI